MKKHEKQFLATMGIVMIAVIIYALLASGMLEIIYTFDFDIAFNPN